MPENIEENKTKISDVDKKLSLHLADGNNPHSVTKKQLGLENVNNTADADKPISIPVRNALDGKTDKTDFENHSDSAEKHTSNVEKANWNDKYSKHETDEKLSLKENVANKTTTINTDSDDTKYPTSKAVKDYVELNRAKLDNQISATSENAIQNKAISASVANALKGTATGNPITIIDISPIAHKMKVSANVGGATVKRTGKNLYPSNKPLSFPANNNYSIECDIPQPFNYSLTINAESENNNQTALVELSYDDGSVGYLTTINWNITFGVSKRVSGTIWDAGKTLKKITFLNWGKLVGTVSDIQIVLGETKADYEPYVEPITSVADEKGNVEGVTSAYPTTILSSEDGVIITAEYNRDINKAFDKLQNAILSLGGNV